MSICSSKPPNLDNNEHNKESHKVLVYRIFSLLFTRSKYIAKILGATKEIEGEFCRCVTVVTSANSENKDTNSCNMVESRVFRHECLYFNWTKTSFNFIGDIDKIRSVVTNWEFHRVTTARGIDTFINSSFSENLELV